MKEPTRSLYLAAMGIDCYVSRSQLPGAAPSRRLVRTGAGVVLPLHSQLLEERVNGEKGMVTRLELEGVNHFDIVLGLSEPFSHLAPDLLPSLEQFIREQT